MLSRRSCPQLWVQERMPWAKSTENGTNLQTVQRLAKRNEVSVPPWHPLPYPGGPRTAPKPQIPPQTLQKELQGHAPRLAEVLERGEAAAGGPCPELAERARELQAQWEALREEVVARQQRLREASEAQQYYLDADEAKAWVSEQELFMGDEEKPKVRVALLCLPVSSGDCAMLCPACHPVLLYPIPCHVAQFCARTRHLMACVIACHLSIPCQYMPSHAMPYRPCLAIPSHTMLCCYTLSYTMR